MFRGKLCSIAQRVGSSFTLARPRDERGTRSLVEHVTCLKVGKPSCCDPYDQRYFHAPSEARYYFARASLHGQLMGREQAAGGEDRVRLGKDALRFDAPLQFFRLAHEVDNSGVLFFVRSGANVK